VSLPQQEAPIATRRSVATHAQASRKISLLAGNSAPAKITHIRVRHSDLLKTEQTDQVLAVEHIRRMHGGSQAQLLRCSDGRHYVVKFQNNPQGLKILASDLLGTLLAIQLGLPAQQPVLVYVREDLIRATEDMVIQLRRGRVPCRSGLCFGSRYPCGQARSDSSALAVVYDYLPNGSIESVENLLDFAGMLVFDQWTCNTDRRQTIFVRRSKRLTYHASMIDQGGCFNGEEWDFPDSPLRGLYRNRAAYSGYRGFDVFEPWLNRLDHETDEETLQLAGSKIPPEWYEGDVDALARLLERLDRRRKQVRDQMWSLVRSSPESFPNWRQERECPERNGKYSTSVAVGPTELEARGRNQHTSQVSKTAEQPHVVASTGASNNT